MFAIDKLTPDQLSRLFYMDSVRDAQKEQAAKVRALRDYYDGTHPSMLTERQEQIIGALLEGNEFPGWAHNHVKSVVDTPRSRLAVTGINLEGLDQKDTTSPAAVVSAAFWDWWRASRLDSEQIRVYRRALRDGSTFVMVDYDPTAQRPRFTLHHLDAGDSDPGIVLHRDPSDANTVMYATRYFTQFDPLQPGATGKRRKTVYLPGEIRKYIEGSAAVPWQPYQDPGDTSWPIPWVNPLTGAPLGIPVIEFSTPGGPFPAQIIPLQNLLNKAWLDLIASADAQGFPMIAMLYDSSRLGPRVGGAQSDANDVGDDEERVSQYRIIEGDDFDVKRIEPGDLTQGVTVIDRIEQAISGMTGIPMYYLRPVGGSDVPSGEALKQLESRLVSIVQELQLVYGQSWEDVFQVAYNVQQAFGVSLPQVDDVKIEVTWQDANVRNDQVIASTAEAHQRLGVPQPFIWRMLGYSPEEIEQFQREQERMMAQETATKTNAVLAAMRTQQTGAQAQGGNNGTVQGQGQTQGRQEGRAQGA